MGLRAPLPVRRRSLATSTVCSRMQRLLRPAASGSSVAGGNLGDDNPRVSKDLGGLRRYGSLAAVGGQNSNDTVIGRSQSTTGRARSYAQRSASAAVPGSGTQKGAAILPGMQLGTLDEDLSRSGAERTLEHLKRQSLALAKIWLLSAASFRRAGQLKECRSAIQEAERLQPGLADVWVQLALYFAANTISGAAGANRLAVDSLYKALACSAGDVAASVHLAGLFLANPELKPKTNVAANDTGKGGSAAVKSTAEVTLSAQAQDLSSVSLAEGLLVATTKGAGWDVSEAWLFLGQAVQRSHRAARARECLEYALQLENTKPIRALGSALLR